jgi:hypothetical protein
METVERHPGAAEKFARLWLIAYQRANPGSGASGYRILDQRGKCLKASVVWRCPEDPEAKSALPT